MKKYIDDRHSLNAETEDEMFEKGRDGHKWVKTDSECKFITRFSFHNQNELHGIDQSNGWFFADIVLEIQISLPRLGINT